MTSREFLHDAPNYKATGHPVTPYLRAQQEWDDRIGAIVVQARNWRLGCILSSAASILLSAFVLVQANQNRVIPIVVGVDKERGEPIVVAKVPELAYEPELQEIKFFISQFITLVRSVPSDQVLIKQNWLRAYLFLRQNAANLLNDMTNKDEGSPLKKIGEQTVIVQLVSVVQVAGSLSYQARWEETVYGQHGAMVDHYVMNGVFTIETEPPKTEAVLNQNPLGMYIKSFQWNREL